MKQKIQETKKFLFRFFSSWWFKVFLTLLLVIFIIPLTYYLAYNQRIYPGVEINHIHVGNTTYPQASQIVKQHLEENAQEQIDLKYNDQKWSLDLRQINFSYDVEKTVSTAFAQGRNDKFPKIIGSQFKLWTNHQNISLYFYYDDELLQNQVASLAGQLTIPALEPAVKLKTINNKTVVDIQPGKNGQELMEQETVILLDSRFSQANFQPLALPVKITSPILTEEQTKELKAKAENLLGKKIVIKFEENSWELKEEDLISFLGPQGNFDEEKIKNWLSTTASTINRPAQNATFKFESNKAIEFKPAKDGVELDIDESADEFIRKAELLVSENTVEVTLVTKITPPQITTDKVNNLGIKEKIGTGYSSFKGSIASRIHNITLATGRINGTLIAPGEVFSFNQTVGDISASTGYQQAYIIQNGRTVLGDGGGVCQVSTTLFRAALASGLEITERHAHAYRVSYYEQGSPAGIDATVFSPTADFKFKNNTDNWVLIQSTIDTAAKKMQFDLYGTKDNRQINQTTPKIYDQVAPPADLYQDDPTLPAGQIKQIDWKAWGAKVIFDYLVEKDGQVLQKKTFYSNYRPWQAVFLRGTKI